MEAIRRHAVGIYSCHYGEHVNLGLIQIKDINPIITGVITKSSPCFPVATGAKSSHISLPFASSSSGRHLKSLIGLFLVSGKKEATRVAHLGLGFLLV